MTTSAPPLGRAHRRREQTRAALLDAARTLLAEERTGVPVAEITALADVGTGSFYNHFSTKEELFEAALLDALEQHGAIIDSLTADVDDPAVVLAQGFRLTGRLHRTEERLSKVLISHGARLVTSSVGLAPRALRDVEAGQASGRFTVADARLAVTVVGGALLCLGQLLHDEPERDAAEASDQVAEDLLRMLGVPADEARAISRAPLPHLDCSPTRTTSRTSPETR